MLFEGLGHLCVACRSGDPHKLIGIDPQPSDPCLARTLQVGQRPIGRPITAPARCSPRDHAQSPCSETAYLLALRLSTPAPESQDSLAIERSSLGPD